MLDFYAEVLVYYHVVMYPSFIIEASDISPITDYMLGDIVCKYFMAYKKATDLGRCCSISVYINF